MRIAPGDPVDAILGSGADEISREILRYKLGLNEPLIEQYLEYLNTAIEEGDIWISDCIDNIGETCVNGFYEENNEVIFKPLDGMGGQSIFRVPVPRNLVAAAAAVEGHP